MGITKQEVIKAYGWGCRKHFIETVTLKMNIILSHGKRENSIPERGSCVSQKAQCAFGHVLNF